MTINTTGVVVNMVAGLLVMPYLILTMGTSTYGLWILIGTLTGYLGVLDLGVSGVLGRLIAAHRAREEHEDVNVVMSTALALLLVVFLAVCVATYASLSIFPRVFSVPGGNELDVRHALILVGLNLAVTFPASIFSGFLWGHERFDLQNSVDIPILILRTALSLTILDHSMPLTSLGAIAFGVSMVGSAIKAVICFRLDPDLRLSARYVRRRKITEILSIGGWMSVIQWSRTLIPQIAPTLIGIRLGDAAVTTFAVGRQLVAYTNVFLNSATQVMAPRAIAAFATSAAALQRQLFIEGGKFSYALTLYFCGGLVCLGQPFIHWWQHGLQDNAFKPLIILLLGESLPMSQWLTYSVLIGANRQRTLGALAVLEGIISLPLILAFIAWDGIAGVCAGVALAAFSVRGLAQWLYGCQLLKISPATYARRVFLPVTLWATLPIAGLYFATALIDESPVWIFLALSVAYSVAFAVTLGWALLGYSKARALLATGSIPTEI